MAKTLIVYGTRLGSTAETAKVIAGVLTENAKRNWTIGIRTPWTLSNETVWNKTHKIGGKLFKIVAIISLSGLFLQKYAIFLIIVPVISVAIYTIIYSYVEYRKQKPVSRL